jgi:hypothetical protein
MQGPYRQGSSDVIDEILYEAGLSDADVKPRISGR